MKKRILSIFIICVFMLMALPMSTFAATNYNVWVGGTQFTSAKTTITCGSGTAKYAPSTKTLTLTNAKINGSSSFVSGMNIGILSENDLTVVLSGSNTVNAWKASDASVGIFSLGKLTVKGSGSLKVVGGETTAAESLSCGIMSSGALTFSGTGAVTSNGSVAGGKNAVSCGVYSEAPITISGAGTYRFNGGKSTSFSVGLYSDSTFTVNANADVRIVGGAVTSASENGAFSCGVEANGVTVSNGRFYAGSSSDTYKLGSSFYGIGILKTASNPVKLSGSHITVCGATYACSDYVDTSGSVQRAFLVSDSISGKNAVVWKGGKPMEAYRYFKSVPVCELKTECAGVLFDDMPAPGDWRHAGIDFAVKQGLFNGTGDRTFSPDTTMSRAMLVTVLWRYEGSPTGYACNFKDVSGSTWYTAAVAWASSNHIVDGTGNGKFDPDGNVTREQMAEILYRYTSYKGFSVGGKVSLTGFPDGKKVSNWAKDGMSWAVGNGLIQGAAVGGKTYLNPQNGATRAQVAAIFMRYINKYSR